MNLPVTGNHARLVERLRSANGTRQLSATTRNKRADGRVAKRSSTSSKRSQQAARGLDHQSATSNLASEPHDLDQVLDHLPEEEESATSDLLVDLDAEPMESMESSDAGFTTAQLAAIQDTVSSTVQAAFQSLPHNDVIPPAPTFFSTPSPRVSSVAPPNGLNRPLDKALEDKILRAPTTNPMTAPHQEPSKKPRQSALICFNFNKPSGCQRRTCHFPHNCHRCGSSSHALFNCPSSKQHATSTKSATPGDRSKK